MKVILKKNPNALVEFCGLSSGDVFRKSFGSTQLYMKTNSWDAVMLDSGMIIDVDHKSFLVYPVAGSFVEE